MGILNSESSLMEIVKLIGSDVLPDDQKLTLEIARVIRLGFLQMCIRDRCSISQKLNTRRGVLIDCQDEIFEHHRAESRH